MNLNYFNAGVLSLGPYCSASCLGCGFRSSHPDQVGESILKAIETDTLSTLFPLHRHMHVLGGDPLLYSWLPILLQYLKGKGCTVSLWLVGGADLDVLSESVSYIDQAYLYCPDLEASVYLDQMGVDGLSHWHAAFSFLLKRTRRLILHRLVSPDTIQTLPDTYTFAYDHRVPLVLHYDPRLGFSGDSLSYIKRYDRISRVSVYRTQYFEESGCPLVPMAVIYDSYQQVKNQILNGINGFRVCLNLGQ